MRSKLFVPAARPDLFKKALASEADAISFDLEDSVPMDRKAEARACLAAFLKSDAARKTGKRLIVRINGFDGPFALDDLAALTGSAAQLVNLPKADTPDVVRMAAASTHLPLLINIETPKALRMAPAIAASHPQVIGLQVGLNDLFAPLGIDRRDPGNVHAALWQIRFAAGEAGCFAYDGAWPDLMDLDGYRAEARRAHALGFRGKSCIHPNQVAVANAVFGQRDELSNARRLLAAAQEAETKGHGAFTLDGQMVDRPAIERARALLAASGDEA